MSAPDASAAAIDPEAAPPSRGLGRPFLAQVTATGLANVGDGILATFTPLVALGLTTSPAQISLLQAAAWLPWLLLGIAAGVLIDRIDRRRAQIGALTARALILAAGAGLAASGHLTMPVLLTLVLCYGATEVVADLGATAIVPDLVTTDQLSAANGRIVGVQQVANNFLGAPLAGALIVAGTTAGFGASAGLAALAACVLALGLRGRFRHTPRAERGAQSGTNTSARRTTAVRTAVADSLAETRDGLRYLVHHRVMRPLTINSALLNMASSGYFAVFVLWVVGPTSQLRLTEAQYPLLMLGFAAGAVAGSLLVSRVQARLGEIPTMMGSLVINTLLLLTPLWITNPWVLGALLAVIGGLNTMGNVVSMSLRQRIVPRALLGRVGGAGRALAYGLMPIGAVLGGLIAEQWGLRATFIAAVALSLVSLAIVLRQVTPAVVARYESA